MFTFSRSRWLSLSSVALACGFAPALRAQFAPTSLTSTPPTSATSPAVLNVGQNYASALTFTISFNQLGTTIARIEIRGTIPPGLSTGGVQEGDANVVANRPNAVLFGTPTTPGDYILRVNAVSSTGTNSISQTAPWEIFIRVVSAGTAPQITSQPASQSASAGGSITFSVGASGDPAPAYQWRRDGTAIAGATSASLTLNNVTAASAGSYTVVVTNSAGSVTSTAAALTVASTAGPVISTQPLTSTAAAGSTVALAVVAGGTPAPTYQWRRDGTPIAGATDAQLVLSSVAAANAGSYTVVVSNSAGSVTSNAAVLRVESGITSQLINLSVRANLAASQTLIVGFSSTASKNILVRAIGPSLANFGIASGFHPDPRIELFSGSTLTTQNDDWSASLSTVFTTVGAFPLAANGRDAALQASLAGPHTAQVKGSGAGIVLVEVYDAGTGSARLANVSARNQVGTGENILISGFVIGGTAAKTLLIRGIGPTLASFGVGGTLADPKLEIFNSANVRVAENDNWNASIGSVFASVGAFALTAGSRDSALLVTLPAGLYTAQLSGVANGTGEALVEVYEVP